MIIKGDITILIGAEFSTIEVKDREANTTFLSIELTPEDLSRALSRQAHVKCDLDIRGIDKVGKKHEHSTFEFKLPPNYKRRETSDRDLAQHVDCLLSDGWECDAYFKSQTSFFKKDGEYWGRAIIRRYV